jgi:hypothetical protein
MQRGVGGFMGNRRLEEEKMTSKDADHLKISINTVRDYIRAI